MLISPHAQASDQGFCEPETAVLGHNQQSPRAVSAVEEASPPRIESLKVQNFRALCSVELKKLTPLTVLVGPNGSGKSTVFDVFAFLSECFEFGLRRAWDRRGQARELRTRGSSGPITVEIKYRERQRPIFLDALRPEQVRVLWRDQRGHTRTRRVAELRGVNEFIEEGAHLGSLWMEGHFGLGDPLTDHGAAAHQFEPARERGEVGPPTLTHRPSTPPPTPPSRVGS